MTVETIVLTLVLAGILFGVRAALPALRPIWREARVWERTAIIVLLVLPLPGPFDELGAAALIARIHRRIQP